MNPIESFRNGAHSRQAVLVALAALGGAILLFALWFFVVRTPYVTAFSNLESKDAVTIVAELERLKTPYKLADGGTSIRVPEDQVDTSRINILGGDLPLKGAVGFELFNKTDMGLTEFAQKINYQRALQGELARTIMSLDEIESARVHLSLPEAGIFERDKRVAKASVTVSTKLGGDIDRKVVHGIQKLVASAVPELDPANVAILDARGELLSDEAQGMGLPSPLQQQQSAKDQYFAGRVREALQAAGLAMPLRVDIISPAASTSPVVVSADDASPTSDPLGGSPRTTPLQVIISVASDPGATVKERIESTAKSAIGFDELRDDSVVLQIDPSVGIPAVPQPTPSTMPNRSPTAPISAEPANVPVIALWPFALVAVLGLMLWAFFRVRRSSEHMGEEQRASFADRLKALLEEAGLDADPTR